MINLNDIDEYLLNNKNTGSKNVIFDVECPDWEKLGFSLAKDLKNGSRVLDIVFTCERQNAKSLYLDNVYIFAMINSLPDLTFSKIFKNIYNSSFPIIPTGYVKSLYEKIESDLYEVGKDNTKCIEYLTEIQIVIYFGILSVFLWNKNEDTSKLLPPLDSKPEIVDNKIDIISDEKSIKRALRILGMDTK